jgi:hypothetical protein
VQAIPFYIFKHHFQSVIQKKFDCFWKKAFFMMKAWGRIYFIQSIFHSDIKWFFGKRRKVSLNGMVWKYMKVIQIWRRFMRVWELFGIELFGNFDGWKALTHKFWGSGIFFFESPIPSLQLRPCLDVTVESVPNNNHGRKVQFYDARRAVGDPETHRIVTNWQAKFQKLGFWTN